MLGEENRRPFKPSLYVVKRFLEPLDAPNREFKKTELQYAVNLNHNVFKKYLHWLQDDGFITITKNDHNNVIVKITGSGREYLEGLRKVVP
jgi:predicted transcriptional regulator